MGALTTTLATVSRRFGLRRAVAMLAAFVLAVAVPTVLGSTADAAIVAPVPLGTSAQFSVLAGTTVTNTGPSVLDGSVGVSPGSAVVGFPPGTVNAPATIQAATAVAATAQDDLTIAYDNAAGRPINATVPADLAGLTLVGGVYGATANGPLGLTGTVTLDGAGDPSSVFIFQTGSTLITGTDSTVALINGAQECNVYWQVGSSATLDVRSTFRGNILALTSITVASGSTVHGRALARNGAVTLDSDVFRSPTCDLTTTTSSVATSTTASGATSTTAPGATSTTAPGATSTTAPGATSTTAPGSTSTVAPSTTVLGGSTSTSGAAGGGLLPGSSGGSRDRTRATGERTASGLPVSGAGLLSGSVVLAVLGLGGGVALLRARSRLLP